MDQPSDPRLIADSALTPRWTRATPQDPPWVSVGRIGEPGGQAETWLVHEEGQPSPRFVLKQYGDSRWSPAYAEKNRATCEAFARMEFDALKRVHQNGARSALVRVVERSPASETVMPWIVLEHVEGDTLKAALDASPSPDWLLDLLFALVGACADIHRAGTAHRDMHWLNVLLRASSDPHSLVVIDFGLACSSVSRTRTIMAPQGAGFAGFTPPERALHRDLVVDRKSLEHALREDVWATAAILYRAVTRRFPYDDFFVGWNPDDDQTDSIYWGALQAMRGPTAKGGAPRLTRADTLARWLPPAVADVLETALSVEPAQRYADCRELEVALQLAAGGHVLRKHVVQLQEIVETQQREIERLSNGLLRAVEVASKVQGLENRFDRGLKDWQDDSHRFASAIDRVVSLGRTANALSAEILYSQHAQIADPSQSASGRNACPNSNCRYENESGRETCRRCGAMLSLIMQDDADSLIGQSIMNGRYRIRQLIAAEDPNDREYLAEKRFDYTLCRVMVKTHGFEQPEQEHALLRNERLRVEADILGTLKHPNTVRCYELGCLPDGRVFVVLEILEGENLARVMARGALPASRIEHLLSQVCNSIAEVHEIGALHRYITPQNIIITVGTGVEDFVKTTGFSIAHWPRLDAVRGSRLWNEDATVGSPWYGSPEQLVGEPLGPASDIYALGVLAYEMLTGCMPFPGENVRACIRMKLDGRPTPIEHQPGGEALLPRHKAAVMRALERDSAKRPQSVFDFLRLFKGEVEPAVESTPVRDDVAAPEDALATPP